jgi:hypothetical protein
MPSRFGVLSFVTGLFQIICGLALLLGLFAIFGNNNVAFDPNNPFTQVSAEFRIIGGLVLTLYGLTGLVFSGGVSVLISIDESTHFLATELPGAMMKLQKAISAMQPADLTAPVLHTNSPPLEAPVSPPRTSEAPSVEESQTDELQSDITCANCGATNDPRSRFCEICGSGLSST